MYTLENAYRTGLSTLLGRGLAGLLVIAAGMPLPAKAADPAYQAFFSGVCPSAPAGSNFENVCLAAGTGISGDSESSLNPSQPLAGNDQPLARAREEAQSQRKRQQADSNPADAQEPALQLGPFSLLVNGRGSWFDRDPSGEERGYDGDAYGIEIGFDRSLSQQVMLGGFLSYERTDVDFDDDLLAAVSAGGIEADSYSAVLFGVFSIDPNLYLEASAGYGVSDYEFRRNAVAQDSNGIFTIPVRTSGDSDGHDYWFSAGAGYDVYRGAASYGLFARTTWARARIDGYRERDLNASGFALIVDDANRTSLTTTLGMRASRAVSFDWGVLVPQLRVEYEHEFENDPPGVDTAFAAAPGASFAPARDDPDQDRFNLAVGTQFILPGGLMPYVEAEALVGQRNFDRYRVLLGVRSEF